MKKSRAVLAALVGALAGSPVMATITFYKDAAAFDSALAAVQIETFSGNVLHVPGLSFVSPNGAMTSSLFLDTVATGFSETVWKFEAPVNGFGGNFDLRPAGPGYGLQFLVDGVRLPTSVSRTAAGQFIGFVSSQPISAVVVQSDLYQVFGPGLETYTLDNLRLGVLAVPEPGTALMWLGGLAAVAAAAKRRSS